MVELPSASLLMFLMPFHVAGGVAFGAALWRASQNGLKLSSILANGFLLIWGLMFGGIPLLFGLGLELGWFTAVQLGLFLGTVTLVFLRYEWLRNLYSQPGMWVATFGLAFSAIGSVVGFSLSSAEEPVGLLVGLILGGVGIILLMVGAWMLLRSR